MSNTTRHLLIAPLLALTFGTACSDLDDQDLGTEPELRSLQLTTFTTGSYASNPRSGMWLNTNNMGDWPFAAFALDGSMRDHIQLLDVRTGPFTGSRPGWEHDDIAANESITMPNGVFSLDVNGDHMLEGETHGGQFLQHGDFHDSIWTVQLDPAFIAELDAAGINHDGAGVIELRLEVDWILPELGPEGEEFDPFLTYEDEDEDERRLSRAGATPVYTFFYTKQNADEPFSTCNTSALPNQISTSAVFYRDVAVDDVTGDIHAEDNLLHIACTTGAVGKVASKWGYWPDQMDPQVQPGEMRGEFELGVRVVRADYCGDGQSWTVPGTRLELFDNYLHTATPNNANDLGSDRPKVEAIWGERRALCIDERRVAGSMPTCHDLHVSACGGKQASFGDLNASYTPARFVTRLPDIREAN